MIVRKTTASQLLAELRQKAAEEERRRDFPAADEVQVAAVTGARLIKRRLQAVFGMVVVGVVALAVAAVLTHFGLSEQNAELATTVTFFALLIGGAWAYDRFIGLT